MFLERKKVRYRILSLFIRFWDFIKSTQVHIHTTHVPLVVYLANLTVLLGSEGGNDPTAGPCVSTL